MPEQALVRGDTDPRALHLPTGGLTANCQVNSQTCAIAWAGMASPKQASPPDALTGTLPPSAVARRAAGPRLRS